MCLYIIPVIGVTVTTHYCGGKLSSVAVYLSGTEKCACGSKKMKRDCCKTTTCTFSMKEVQQKNGEYTFGCNDNFKVQPAITTTTNCIVQSLIFENNISNHHFLPDKITHSLYLLHQVFRI